MKRYIFILACFIVSFSGCKTKQPVGANRVTYNSALEYNNYIINRQKKVVEDIAAYAKAMQISTDAGNAALDKVISSSADGLRDIKGMPAYNNDSAFRDAAIDLFAFYKKSFSTDFKEMLEIRKRVDSSKQTENDLQRFKTLQDNVTNTETPLDNKMKAAQANFAKNNNLDLSDKSVQEELDKIKKK